jgi:hypothetical protein
MEFRKLYIDMTSVERTEIHNKLKDKQFSITPHTIKRQKEKVITDDEIQRAINDCKIIEYHYKDGNRVLIRGRKSESKYNICVVLDLDNNYVVTAYDNKATDNHYNLDTSKYITYINILNLLKSINN